ncbi:thiazole synthase, partial [Kocuria sp. CCUG 69068]|nr:thiazole synthase [Kocuria sp. CCUG 69068]
AGRIDTDAAGAGRADGSSAGSSVGPADVPRGDWAPVGERP